jgi:hypothetical protein
MVAPDAPIQSAADLKGKTIEILPYAVEPFLLHGHVWLHHWLSQLDPAVALERAFKTRIESGAIKTDKTPQELVCLHYRKLD